MSLRSRLETLRQSVPDNVKIIVVSKFHPSDTILEAYDAGQRVFGESRVQELVAKQAELPKDIEWHFVGSLQRNKVKQIAPFISLIHSVENERLIHEIERQAAANHRTIPCLLQIHVAEEETKLGFSPGELRAFLAQGTWRNCSHVQLVGVMGMATFTDDSAKVREEFRLLKSLFDEIKNNYFPNDALFKEISMGMSDDYPIAIEESSTMVRVGSLIFGDRK